MRCFPFTPLLLLALLTLSACVSIERGWITIETKTGETSDRLKVDLNSSLKQVLNLTQSSLINLQAKVNPLSCRSPSLMEISNQSSSPSAFAIKFTMSFQSLS